MEQQYFWRAWYLNTTLSEFNGVVETPFNSIDKSKLTGFGIYGRNKLYFYEVKGGHFTIDNHEYSFKYEDTWLTSKEKEYRDIIQFKDAESCIGLGGRPFSTIIKHNFGWKENLGDLRAQIIYEIPIFGEQCFKVRLVSSVDRIGKLKVYRDGVEYLSVKASLLANRAGEARITL